MKRVVKRLAGMAVTTIITCIPAVAGATPIWFGPTHYTSEADVPSDFFSDTCVGDHVMGLETFEDNSLADFLSIDNGGILLPNATSGTPSSVTDSVDGDDGSIDGNGNGGHSWFYGPGTTVTITFDEVVTAAGVVWTDGPSFADVLFEAFDGDGISLGTIGPADIADAFYTGQTGEDHFFGIKDDGGIGSIALSVTSGSGIELDHITWELCTVPEPSAMALLVGAIGLVGIRRRRK
ncbi:PEP-CTERM sorting domain-containing protein [Planctomycetota bacterium]